MRNREMGMEMPQEFREQPAKEKFEEGGEKQEATESVMQEFQKEEEESLSAKDKKEKTTQSRWKRALCAMTAGLILFGSAEAGFAKEKAANETEKEMAEQTKTWEFKPTLGAKIEHGFNSEGATIIEIKQNGELILLTEDGKRMELRPTKREGIYEFDAGGSKLTDGAIDISEGKMDEIYNYGKIDGEIKDFYGFLDPKDKELIDRTSLEKRGLDFYEKIQERINAIDMLKISKIDNNRIVVTLLNGKGGRISEVVNVPKGCEILETERYSGHSEYAGVSIEYKNGDKSKIFSGELVLDEDGNIMLDRDSKHKQEKLKDIFSNLENGDVKEDEKQTSDERIEKNKQPETKKSQADEELVKQYKEALMPKNDIEQERQKFEYVKNFQGSAKEILEKWGGKISDNIITLGKQTFWLGDNSKEVTFSGVGDSMLIITIEDYDGTKTVLTCIDGRIENTKEFKPLNK